MHLTTIGRKSRQQLEDPELVDLYRGLGEAIEWQPDDRRLPGLADRLAAFMTEAEGWEEQDTDDDLAAGLVELIDSVFLDAVPVARRFVELMEERGWSGWTKLERVPVAGHSPAQPPPYQRG
jgi:hypothetical protein